MLSYSFVDLSHSNDSIRRLVRPSYKTPEDMTAFSEYAIHFSQRMVLTLDTMPESGVKIESIMSSVRNRTDRKYLDLRFPLRHTKTKAFISSTRYSFRRGFIVYNRDLVFKVRTDFEGLRKFVRRISSLEGGQSSKLFDAVRRELQGNLSSVIQRAELRDDSFVLVIKRGAPTERPLPKKERKRERKKHRGERAPPTTLPPRTPQREGRPSLLRRILRRS